MIFVLDTSALFHKSLFAALIRARQRGADVTAVLPAVAFAERLRQIKTSAERERRWRSDLAAAGIVVEAFDHAEAARLPVVPDDAWRRHARDYLIQAHVHSGRIAVSADEGPAWRATALLDPDGASDAIEALSAR